MVDHLATRRNLLAALREELVGPSPQGSALDCSGELRFATAEQARGPWKQYGSGEEVLLRDTPTKRYGIGVLYPRGARSSYEPDDTPIPGIGSTDATPSGVAAPDVLSPHAADAIERSIQRGDSRSGTAVSEGPDADDSELDLSSANAYKPSCMAVSFLARLEPPGEVIVDASGGRYHQKLIAFEEANVRPWRWWLREPVSLSATFAAADIASGRPATLNPRRNVASGTDGMGIRLALFVRPHTQAGIYLCTAYMLNTGGPVGNRDEQCLFQSTFRVSVESHGGASAILPYPAVDVTTVDPEDQALELLYRASRTYGVGHGCAADWEQDPTHGHVLWVSAESFPTVETKSITPDITDERGQAVSVSMASLAGLIPDDDGFFSLTRVIDLYANWISAREGEIQALPQDMTEAGQSNLARCRDCLQRMRDGLRYLKDNTLARRAFQLANHAMLLQQLHSFREARTAIYDAQAHLISFTPPYEPPDPLNPPKGRGYWRAFQIAFLLMTVQSTGDPSSPDRELVDLIWFPTGGGKTEAYLGLAAYNIFLRRLRDKDDRGVQVLMRYTLRLLTAQQFLRASSLACAMEYLRSQNLAELGDHGFSVGMWLGSATTPNTRASALDTLHQLAKGQGKNEFVLTRCPWCGAQMGIIKYPRRTPARAPRILGYQESGGTVVFRCEEQSCDFHAQPLPVFVIDEDVYEYRPSMVIGTVDKFAMLAWKPEARSIFGIGDNGERLCSPPGLIIQDELHLISGPLGSMVGLYEGVLEELCTDRRSQPGLPPKIVCSTATIRRYSNQVAALFGRQDVALFPPPGLDIGDSFFAKHACTADGSPLPGRMYVGVHAPGLGSMQTAQVRTLTSLLQAPLSLDQEQQDPWWTLVVFFNSLRELGTSLSLLQSDIPDYLKALCNRTGTDWSEMRRLNNILELTSRLDSEEVTDAIAALEVPRGRQKHPVDVCLASSIIEVGIDIDRLSLMVVTGQPKSTSQYIQVTGRIGRNWAERPGLVITIYGASKPRDRSHFEKFRTYHERLYAQVEPTSVTPFSSPALSRALHAAIVSYVRQAGDLAITSRPYPYPAELVNHIHDVLLERVSLVAPSEVAGFERAFGRRAKEWQRWQRSRWSGSAEDGEVPLLWRAGEYINSKYSRVCWSTPQSMRNVDAECEVEITQLYLDAEDCDHA